MVERYSLKYLNSLKTISESQTDDLKIERKGYRVWLSRLTKEDGMPYDNQVTIEEYKNTSEGWYWIITKQYQAR